MEQSFRSLPSQIHRKNWRLLSFSVFMKNEKKVSRPKQDLSTITCKTHAFLWHFLQNMLRVSEKAALKTSMKLKRVAVGLIWESGPMQKINFLDYVLRPIMEMPERSQIPFVLNMLI